MFFQKARSCIVLFIKLLRQGIVSVGPDDNKYLRIELFGESFVYNQIRYMIGFLLPFK